MRKTLLKRTSMGVVLFTLSIAVLMAVFRALILTAGEATGQSGAALFQEKGCVNCHYPDKTETKVGPGLKNLFERDTLPVSKRSVTEENIRRQLDAPYQNMPSYADRLTDEQKEALVTYLKSL